MLMSDEECQCPRGRLHDSKCPWYNPDVIYILDKKDDLSISEQAAQQKIYQMYQNTLNNPPESCGCGTAAAIAYMGHNTGCIKFLHMYERESCVGLLAILKKRKKVTFHEDTVVEPKRAKMDPAVETDDEDDPISEIPDEKEIPIGKGNQPKLSQAQTDELSKLADESILTTNNTPLNNPPNSLPDLITDTEKESVSAADCPGEEDEIYEEEDNEETPPLEDIDH